MELGLSKRIGLKAKWVYGSQGDLVLGLTRKTGARANKAKLYFLPKPEPKNLNPKPEKKRKP